MSEAQAIAALVGASLLAYALLAGADFGGGIWDLLARGPRAEAERSRIARSMGPVWEANHVWLVFAVVLLFSAFPPAFGLLSRTLELPVALALLGIVLRGAAFAFRGGSRAPAWERAAWSRIFSLSSLLAPFALGAAAGAVASGRVRPEAADSLLAPFRGALPLLAGALAVVVCAYLAAVYLCGDARREGERELEEAFRRRALASGVLAGLLTAAALLASATTAPALWRGLTGPALPALALSALGGAATLAALRRRRYRLSRAAAALAVAGVFAGWAAAQWPDLLPGVLSVHAAAAPEPLLRGLLVAALLGLALVLPSLALLLRVFQQGPPR